MHTDSVHVACVLLRRFCRLMLAFLSLTRIDLVIAPDTPLEPQETESLQ